MTNKQVQQINDYVQLDIMRRTILEDASYQYAAILGDMMDILNDNMPSGSVIRVDVGLRNYIDAVVVRWDYKTWPPRAYCRVLAPGHSGTSFHKWIAWSDIEDDYKQSCE